MVGLVKGHFILRYQLENLGTNKKEMMNMFMYVADKFLMSYLGAVLNLIQFGVN